MVKILLLAPPIFDFYFTPARSEPLGLLYIQSALETIPGIQVDLHDATASGRKKRQKRPSCFDHLAPLYVTDTSCFSLFSHYYRFGDSFDKIIGIVDQGQYDIVAISSLFSGYHPDVEELVIRIKNELNTTVVLGGWAIEAEPEKLFHQSKADAFLLGDGEHTFPLFIRAFLGERPFSSVPGLLYKKSPHSTIELHTIPLTNKPPCRIENRYSFAKKKSASVVLSRGCHNRCQFCAIHASRPYSRRSLGSLEKEMTYLKNSGTMVINFEDDNLFHGREFSEALLDRLESFHEQGLFFTAMNGITASNIQPFAKRLIQAGFIELNLSLVAAKQQLTQSYKRPFTLSTIEEVVAQVSDTIPTLVFLILGLPQSTPQDTLLDILALAKLPVRIGVSPLYLIPNVPLFSQLGLPHDRRLLRGSALYRFGVSFSREDVASLWKYVRMINWLKEPHPHDDCDRDEQLFYFHKSLKEKRWFNRNDKGEWYRGFSFSIDLPDRFALSKLPHSKIEIKPAKL